MKIAIISYYYKHKCAMASVRAEKLAKYLACGEDEITVLTSLQRDTWTTGYKEPARSDRIREIYAPEIKKWGRIRAFLDKRKKRGLERIALSTVGVQEAVLKKSVFKKIKDYFRWLFYFSLAKAEDKCLVRGLIKEYKRQGAPRFDVAIASYPSYGAVLFGEWLKRHGRTRRLVLDLRDPIVNPAVRAVRREIRYDKRCQKRAMRWADLAVCVSHGILDSISDNADASGVICRVITNGYDPDDIPKEKLIFSNGSFNFLYTGSLYHGKRRVDMLASALRELIDEGKIDESDVGINYCGTEYEVLLSQLEGYSLSHTAKTYGEVSRDKSLMLQGGADALILITWNESGGGTGVIPGKLFEYISQGVPTVALVLGDLPHSEVREIIEGGGFGIAAEEADFDKEKFKSELLQLIKGELRVTADSGRFSYPSIAEEYRNFIKED